MLKEQIEYLKEEKKKLKTLSFSLLPINIIIFLIELHLQH